MYVVPGGSYSSRVQLAPSETGLVGTIRFRLINNDGDPDDPVYGPSTAGIVEDPTGSGVYLFLGTAPFVVGVYNGVWDLGPGTDLFIDENLIVTSDQSMVFIPSGHDYVTLAQMKKTLEMTGQTFADDDILVSISAASRVVDDMTDRRFWLDPSPTTRTYWPKWSRVSIDDVTSVTDVSLGVGGTPYVMTTNTDYALLPLNAAADGYPYETIQFLHTSAFHPDQGLPALTVTGTFGWPSIPQNVVAATSILTSRILRRQREAPFGIVTIGIEQGATARISQTDPDVQALLSDFTKERVLIAVA